MDELETKEKKEHESSHEPTKRNNFTEKIRQNPWILATIVLGIFSLFLLAIIISGNFTGGVISVDDAGTKLLNFYESMGIRNLSIDSVKEVSGVYEIDFNYNNRIIPQYITKDGKNLISGLTPLELSSDASSSTTQKEIPKSDKPSVDLYVMSFCPYGNEAEKTMQPVYDLLKDSVDWNVHFIVSVSGTTVNSLHGLAEATEDIREACVLKNYDVGTWFTFANYINNNCGDSSSSSAGSCWQDAAEASGVDADTISSCVTSSGLDLMKDEESASKAAGVNGSPTLIINGVQSNAVYKYGNSEAYKGAICSAFNDIPPECSQTLSTTSTAASGSC